jgi:mannitol/fructose-specific phosphotransferase system IIA component (Ntr-type)
MKIHELLTPEAIRLDFAPSPGQELNALISLACSRVSGATSEACQFQEDELHLIHEYMSEGLGILHNLSEAVDKPLLVLALAPAGVRLNGQSCQVLAVLISPLKGSGSHFQLLAKLTSLLRNRRFREEMLAKRSGAEVLRAIKLQEESGHENYWVLSREEILAELQTVDAGLSQDRPSSPQTFDLAIGG